MGIWRIPVDEIDRPGSFASHMSRSIVLLLEVLSQLRDHDTLLKLSFMLQRTPDQGKKYLRDVDRQVLAKRAFFLNVKVLEDNLSSLTGVSEQPCRALGSSMGEMTTSDPSSRPSPQDAPGPPDTKPREGPQTPGPQAPDKGDPPQAPLPRKVEAPGPEAGRAGPEEPMDLEAGPWARPSKPADSQSSQMNTEGPRLGLEPGAKGPESSRAAPELSLEELSISSRQQQQLHGPGARGPLGAGGLEQGPLRRPSRKRKLLEDPESGKTLLLDAYRVWQQGQKVMTYDLGRIEKIMSETYMLIKQVDEEVALDQAVKFCQIQLATSAQRQYSYEAATTPRYTKDHRDMFFPATLPTPAMLSHAACHALPAQDAHPHGRLAYEPPGRTARPTAPSSCHQDQLQARRAALAHSAPTAFHTHTGEPGEGVSSFRQQESGLCQQMKLATVSPCLEASTSTQRSTQPSSTVSPGLEASNWLPQEPGTSTKHGQPSTTQRSTQPGLTQPSTSTQPGSTRPGQPISTQPSCPGQQQYGSGELPKPLPYPDPSRVRSRIPPSMPKLFIPSALTKFPPEITVTPPTPTLLSPKGSISEETKQRLKSVILSSQSAATVKKERLRQPVLEVQETSSQESSLESESEEEDGYMDI